MKRIDDKISEIQKKDKRNRILYIVIVALLIIFMGVVLSYEKILVRTRAELTKSEVEKSKYYQDLLVEKDKVEQKKDSLEMSLRPEDYWKYIKDENSVQGYIEYLTNIWGIQRNSSDMEIAKQNLKLESTIGQEGWIYLGTDSQDLGYSPTDSHGKQIAKISWRQGVDNINAIANTKPMENDILKLIMSKNRNTYKKPSFRSSENREGGWRPGTKAFVVKLEIEQGTTNLWAYIRYY